MRMRSNVVLPQPLGAHSTAGPFTVRHRSRNSVFPELFCQMLDGQHCGTSPDAARVTQSGNGTAFPTRR